MADLIQLRRDTAANWTSANTVLSQGEQGYETDTGKMKIGDGSTAWTSLAYFVDSSAYATSSDITTAVAPKANTADLATVATTGAYADITGTPTLATVATTGAYADITGTPTIPSITGLATETYVDTAVSNLVDTAPEALNTLNELAAALGDDANFATTTATSIGLKANTADLATVATTGAYSDLTGTPTVPTALTDLNITDGTAGQVLSADGDGTYTFIDAASGGGGGGGSFEAVASGEISVGDPVIVNADGTVTVARTNSVFEIGASRVYETSANTQSIASSYLPDMAYDSLSNKIVMLILEKNTSTNRYEYLEAKVLTVTDGVISNVSGQYRVGTAPTGGGSAIMYPTIASDNNGKFLIGWHARSANSTGSNALSCRCRVAVVSGTSLSFGSETIITNLDGHSAVFPIFVPDENKFVIMYQAYTTGTVAENFKYMRTATIVGTSTVSLGAALAMTDYPAYNHFSYVGNSKIAFMVSYNKLVIYEVSGTSVVKRATDTGLSNAIVPPSEDRDMATMGYDPNSGKVLIYISGIYAGYDPTGFNQVFTATISSANAVTYGTPVEVVDANGIREKRGWYPQLAFNTNTNKFLIVLYGSGWTPGSRQYAFTAEINGSDVIVSLPQQTSTNGSSQVGVVYAEHVNRFVVQNGNKEVYTVVYDAVTNVTTQNFVGFSSDNYSNGDTATVKIIGSVDSSQSGLTPAQKYYLQPTGTLSTSVGNPEVFAGTAISSTKLIIKG